MKGLAHRLQEIAFGGDVTHGEFRLAHLDQREHPVVGRDEDVVVGFDDDGPARAANAGIDHHHMHGARREETIRLRDRPRAVEHVVGRHGVTNVNYGCFRMDVKHHAMHDADERIAQPEVGGEGDNARVGHALAKYSQRLPESSPPTLSRDYQVPMRSTNPVVTCSPF